MSRRYLGGLLSSSSPAASTISASGSWSLQQQFIQVGQNAWRLNLPSIMEFVASVDFAATTAPAGPTIPSYVDNTYLGVLLEYTAAYSTTSAPSGWTKFLTEPDPLVASTAALSVYYKILSTSDRGTTPGVLVGGNQRDQLYIFKNSLGPITSVTQGNFQKSQATGSLTATAPTLTAQSAIAIHYYYNSSTATPPISSSPTMTILRSTVNNFHGGQYIIYNAGQTPVNQTIDATLAGTIRQALLWLIVQ